MSAASMTQRRVFAPTLMLAAFLALLAASAGAHEGTDAVPAKPAAPAADALLVAVSGTVIDLVVEDRVANKTLRYVALRLGEGQTIALVGPGLENLPAGARAEAVGRSAGDTLFVTDARLLPESQAPLTQLKQASSTIAVEGTLAFAHSDDFAQGRGHYDLVVVGDDGHATPMKLAVIPASVRRGMRVIAWGSTAADGFSLDTSRLTIVANPAPTPDQVAAAPVTNNVLVMPVRFTDTASEPFTPTQINTEFQTKVAPYYQEVSYGQQLLNITIACLPTTTGNCAAKDANGNLLYTSPGGWLKGLDSTTKLPIATPASCNFTAIGQAADTAATQAGYNLGNYKNRYYVMPSGISCGWAGLAYIGFPYQAWSNGVNALWVYGHELGHNFTLWHAGSLNCPGQVIGGSCTVAEYGDPFDVMGNVRTMHFNSMQKSVLNWIPATSVKTHASGTASYTLSPIESPGQTTYAVKIPASPTRTYWIEFRQPIGFDSPLSTLPNLGAEVRVSSPFDYPCSSCGGDDTEFLDMTPATGGNFSDGTLLAGQAYTDSSNGITISAVSATATALTVQVTVPTGTATTTTLVSSLNPSTIGSNVTFTATVAGINPTGSVNFTNGGVSIATCSAAALSGSGNSRTAQCTTNALTGGAHSIVATYSGDATNAASGSTTLSQTVNKLPSTTGIGTSQTPSTAGISVTFTATVSGTGPTGTVNFKDGAVSITNCSAAAVAGSGNIRTATCATAGLAVGTHSITAAYSGDATNNGSTSATLSQVVNSGTTSVNVALASAGGVASASSTSGGSFPASAINNGDRAGLNFGAGGVWQDATVNAFPDWVEIDFSGAQTIDRVIVYSVQDNNLSPVDPGDTLTFSQRGLTAFNVQTWNGSAWVTQGSVTANNLVKRTVSFTAISTAKIRVVINAALGGKSRSSYVAEVEAWTTSGSPPSPPAVSVALASSINPAKVNQSVTFTATVDASSPTGSVAFTSGGGSIANCAAVALTGSGNSKTASCTTSFAATGTYSIVARYGGDASNAATSSTALSEVVKATK